MITLAICVSKPKVSRSLELLVMGYYTKKDISWLITYINEG